ncbi:DUF1059 domain-containing protein [Pseudophaeobacter sp.]|uniref:DUF1059 domain-containing protein n=1 Tax=Pseudophaeobacter sp. TaxID=1971739 RepID=UPI004059AA9B
MSNAFRYACSDCEGMEACRASVIAETREEVWELIKLHARIAHGESEADWDTATRTYLDTLIKPVMI